MTDITGFTGIVEMTCERSM